MRLKGLGFSEDLEFGVEALEVWGQVLTIAKNKKDRTI